MLKQMILWCAVFMVAVIGAVLIGEMRFHPSGSLELVPVASTAESAAEQAGPSEQSN